ncbi:hypothetical protein [Parvibaculum lavamentivorans]|nr:hypothetical protein [Parvibaculum lavamentivorans]
MQQLVAGDLRESYVNVSESLSPFLTADWGPGVLAWMGVAFMLVVYALFFAPAGRTARDVSASAARNARLKARRA